MSFQCAMFKLKTVSYFVWTFVVFLYQLKSQQCQWWSPFNAYEVFSVITACPECICICVICVPIESTSIRGFHNGGWVVQATRSYCHRRLDTEVRTCEDVHNFWCSLRSISFEGRVEKKKSRRSNTLYPPFSTGSVSCDEQTSQRRGRHTRHTKH